MRSLLFCVRPRGCVLIAAFCVLAFSASTAYGFSEHVTPPTSFGEPCTSAPCGNGQLSSPDGVAVEQSTGDVYVVDTGDDRVEKFTASGVYVSQFGGAGSGAGQLSEPTWVVVSEAGLSPVVYVDDAGNKRIEEFDASGTYVGQLTGTPTGPEGSQVPFSEVGGIAVDPRGNLWVAAGEYVDEFSGSGEFIKILTEAHNRPGGDSLSPRAYSTYSYLQGLAVDSEDNFFGFHDLILHGIKEGGQYGEIYGWTSDGSELGEIDQEQRTNEYQDTGVAIDPGSALLGGKDGFYIATNETFIHGENRDLGYGIGQYGPVCAQELQGQITGGCEQLEVFGIGLLGRTAGVAVNAATGAVYVVQPESGTVMVFAATILPDVVTEEASHAESTVATLTGTVDPDETVITSCEFEYVSESLYWAAVEAKAANPYEQGATAPCSGSASGHSPVSVEAQVTGLEPDAAYHYRLVAANASGEHDGLDRRFVTAIQPVVSGETVSEVAPVTSASSVRVTVASDIDAGGLPTAYSVEYGETTGYGTTSSQASDGDGLGPVGVTVRLVGLSPDRTYHFRFIASNALGTSMGEDMTFTTASLYPASSLLPDGRNYELVSVGDTRLGDVYGPCCEETPLERASLDGNAVTYAGPSSEVGGNGNASIERGNSYLAVRSGAGWSASNITPPNSNFLTYYKAFSEDLSVGVLQLQQVLEKQSPTPIIPGGSPSGDFLRAPNGSFHLLMGPFSATRRTAEAEVAKESYRGASADFKRVVLEIKEDLYVEDWESEAMSQPLDVLPSGALATGATFDAISLDGEDVVWSGAGGLYVREGIGTSQPRTVQVDAPQGGSGPGGGGVFPEGSYGESPDERSRSFNGAQILFTDVDSAGLTSDTVAGSGTNLYQLDLASGRLVDLTAAEHAEVQGVVGTSDDGSYVYFTAAGVLSAANAEGKAPVAGETNLYVSHAGVTSFVAVGMSGMRVTPNGSHLLLQAPTGALYVYDAQAGGLECASCVNGKPVGVTLGNNRPPGEAIERYVPHWISDDGSRVFFEAGSLVPQDTAGASVYEWERQGTGTCETENGCIYLLSGGAEPASFVDASANGNDVFFVTRDSLVPQDDNDYVDLYDSHVGARPVSQPLCSGTGCQGVPPSPPIFATPSSVTFEGVGNFEATTPVKPAVKPKHKAKAAKCKGSRKSKKKCTKAKVIKGKAKGAKKRAKKSAARSNHRGGRR